MFESNILFVVGAGASNEAALPTGNELKATIAKLLDIKFEHGRKQVTGDVQITDALRQHVREPDGRPGDINPYLHAGWRIRDAMPQAISIDNFIDAHQGDEKIELCGKLAIVRSILEAEQKSVLFFDSRRSNGTLNYKTFQGTWYNMLLKLLIEGCRREDINQIFENMSFIIFNYDRCIEHFLFHAVQTYYGIDPAKAADLMQTLTIFHPYGIVGQLPWQADIDSIAFGGGIHGGKLLSLAGQIKTFTERIEDETAIAAIRQVVEDAETIVFLGFAFHRQNMELIKGRKPSNAKRIFATAKGVSDSDCAIIEREIVGLLDTKKRHRIQVNLRNGLTCHSLFGEYWRSLSPL